MINQRNNEEIPMQCSGGVHSYLNTEEPSIFSITLRLLVYFFNIVIYFLLRARITH